MLENVPRSVGGDCDVSNPPGRPAGLDGWDTNPEAAILSLFDVNDWLARGSCWDFRGVKGVERQEAEDRLIADDDLRDEIVQQAERLGMATATVPATADLTVFLALGGARLAPLNRTRNLVEALPGNPGVKHLFLLGTNRPLLEAELESDEVAAYAPGAASEFDMMEGAGRRLLGLAPEHLTVDLGGEDPNDVYQDWAWKIWRLPADRQTSRGELLVHAVKAPTGRPGYRANTPETVEFIVKVMAGDAGFDHPATKVREQIPTEIRPRAGTLFVLSTSAIYRPFQHLDGCRILGPSNYRVQTVGHPLEWTPPVESHAGGMRPVVNLRESINYLQEIRSTIKAAKRLLDSRSR